MTEDVLKNIWPELRYMARKKIEDEKFQQSAIEAEDIRNKFPPGSIEYNLKNARLKDEVNMKQEQESV